MCAYTPHRPRREAWTRMMLHGYGKTERGCVREDNEDLILLDPGLGLFVLCDGMGGRQRGDVAAELATTAIRFYVNASRDRSDVSWPFGYAFELSLDANRLATAIRLANRQVWRRAEQALECAGMGTTVAAALWNEGRIIMANVGDSRAYLFRGGALTQLTVDDTIIASMIQRGLISPADTASHPLRNVVTQAAGAKESIDVHVREEVLVPGDRLLLCSDGLYAVVGEASIMSILAEGQDGAWTVERLISEALTAGAPDNVSVVLLQEL